jgi:hypothetical protein
VIEELTVQGRTTAEKADSNYYPGREPETAQESWHTFVEGAKAQPKKEKPKGEHFDLTKATRDQQEEWQKTGKVALKPEKKESPESEAGTEAEAGAETKGSKTVEDQAVNDDEPRRNDRMWQDKLEGDDLEKVQQHVQKHASRAAEHVFKHAARQQIEAGLRNAFQNRPSQYSDFLGALSEVKNPGEVLAHIGLQKQDRDILLSSSSWQELRNMVHQISTAIQPKPEAKRRPAPKTPPEVGGRGTASEDPGKAAARDGDFAAFEREMKSRYMRASSK